MRDPRVVILISRDDSDIYFANQLMKQLNVVGVFVEKQHEETGTREKIIKGIKYALKPWKIPRKVLDDRFMEKHLENSRRVDSEHFGAEAKELFPDPDCKVVFTKGVRAINEPGYVEQMKGLDPDVIAVCGSSILKKDIIALPSKGVLNLHSGLSQKYRGTYTTFWAVCNSEPEYIGGTVHYVSEGIDDGRIIYQGRPDISPEDDPETLYVKVVKLGIKMMVKAIRDIQHGKVKSYESEELGELYLDRMATPEMYRKMWDNISNGLVREYLDNRAVRDRKVTAIMKGSYAS